LKIRFETVSRQRLGVPVDPQGDVRFEVGQPPGKSIITKTVETFWLLPYKTHAQPMVAQHKTTSFQFGSG
jgi:hypothetical protein